MTAPDRAQPRHSVPQPTTPDRAMPAEQSTLIEVVIGWTRSEVVDGKLVYSSFGDGYKHGASQHQETIVLDMTDTNVPVEKWPEMIADAVFYATNAPRLVYPEGLTGQVCRLIDETDYHGEGAHYSLSTGDTVTVGEIMLECASFGWERVVGMVAP